MNGPSGRLRRRLAVAVAIAAALGSAVAVAQALRAPPAALARARVVTAADRDGVLTADLEVARGQYAPNVVRSRAGTPLRLRIAVRERHGCATRLLVPDLGIDAALPGGGTVDVLVPAAPRGTYLFTCAQRMVKGSLVLE